MSVRVAIGVHGLAEPRRVDATLRAVAACTPVAHEVVRLDDGARGAPAAFNELARRTSAPVLVFLESGVLVSPGWLERLLDALDADPRRGLAGPSTNRAWNEQCVAPAAGEEELEENAAAVAARFGDTARTLAPLYSLGDFCLAVRREVLDATGGADEAYARGPCWEMDFNVRAARAGWHGVWVCGAYVHRTAPSPQRLADDARYFESSRRLYQDRFCGARLRGEKKDYRRHCRGDACANFAPKELVRIDVRQPRHEAPPMAGGARPLVSCITPTRNRRDFLPAAIRLFLEQDYEPRELVILDDGEDCVRDLVPDDPRIRFLRREPRMTVGAKRNALCEEARGDLVAHWDDDDWYPSWRLREQVQALLRAEADVCGSSALHFHDAANGRAWEYRFPPAKGWMAGTTLLYRKAFWERNRFPSTNNGEDSAFLFAKTAKVLHDLADPRLAVAAIHRHNTAAKPHGSLWRRCPVETVLQLKSAAMPLISCVMPTYNRRRFVPHALQCFAAQTWPERELIVVDDGDEPVEDLCAGLPHVRYFRLDRRASLGAKRAFGAQRARGELVAQWDDDDWYAPARLAMQAAPIVRGEADLTGFCDTLVLDTRDARFWSMTPDVHGRAFLANVAAGTLVFRRSMLGDDVRYPDANCGEDAMLLDRARKKGFRLQAVPNDGAFVYVRHGANTWQRFIPGRFIDPAAWREAPRPPLLSDETLALLTAPR